MKFTVRKSKDGSCYYIFNEKISCDAYIAVRVNMTLEDYRQFLIDNFNGFIKGMLEEIYFPTEEDANKASEWIESMFVFNKIANNEPQIIYGR